MTQTLDHRTSPDPLTVRSFHAIGTTATVVVQEPSRAESAERMLREEIESIDLACSRFRSDSELEMVHAHAGAAVRVSSLLFSALAASYEVAEHTHGAVDPTVGNAIAALGYDADLSEVQARPANPVAALRPVAGFTHLHLNSARRTVRIPRGVRLDLGSSAKAFAADHAAARICHELGSGVLVSLGGDIAGRRNSTPGRLGNRHCRRLLNPGRPGDSRRGRSLRRTGQLEYGSANVGLRRAPRPPHHRSREW